MKSLLVALVVIGVGSFSIYGQERCSSAGYLRQQLPGDPSLQGKMEQIERFIADNTGNQNQYNTRTNSHSQVIKIPVVFHVLYHRPEENITDLRIQQQVEALNRDFRRKNADTVKTPAIFAPLAADMEIEFELAKSDPRGGSTTGIIRKYTPVVGWMGDDKMKFTAAYGDDAWESKHYLNIWVCNLLGDLGYAAFPGGDAKKDGIVLNFRVVGFDGAFSQYGMGRTGVHEAGHWLSLKHLWGDAYCGDDNVGDTPKQSSFTSGCPSGIRTTCNNAPHGDMYMNYMDFTNDACMNLFTEGQKQRARVLFEAGGARHSILFSKGLSDPQYMQAPSREFHPTWLYANVYPNPAASQLTVYFEYDERWLGKELLVLDINGKLVMKKIIRSAIERLDVKRLNAGVYFIRARKDDESLVAKFVKQ